MKINLTPKDFDEAEAIAGLLKQIDRIDADYVNSISDNIFKEQPFFLTVLLGYRHDVSMHELEEIMKIYLIVWEYFKVNPNVKKNQITESYFNNIQNRNIEMFNYSAGELNDIDKLQIYFYDLQNLKSKSLLTAVLFRFNERPILKDMDMEKKKAIIIGIKSFIECFETI